MATPVQNSNTFDVTGGDKSSTTLLQTMKTVKKGEQPESPYRRKHYKVPEYLKAMTEIEKEINHKIIKNMSKRINYLRNPRFKVNKASITFDEVKKKVSASLILILILFRNFKGVLRIRS